MKKLQFFKEVIFVRKKSQSLELFIIKTLVQQ
jgi:hypothetical protein